MEEIIKFFVGKGGRRGAQRQPHASVEDWNW